MAKGKLVKPKKKKATKPTASKKSDVMKKKGKFSEPDEDEEDEDIELDDELDDDDDDDELDTDDDDDDEEDEDLEEEDVDLDDDDEDDPDEDDEEEDDDDEEDEAPPPKKSSKSSAAPWAVTGKSIAGWAKKDDEIRKTSATNRKPEFWLGKGESKDLLFPEDEPLAAIFVHSICTSGNPKKGPFLDLTCSQGGFNPNAKTQKCPLCKAGHKPSLKTIWMVVDIEGYEKDGKSVPFVPRFWVTYPKRCEILDKQIMKKGTLAKRIVTMNRGKDGQYSMGFDMAEKEHLKGLAKVADKIKELRDKFTDLYAPPDAETAKSAIRLYLSSGEEVED